nr:SDR family NAD(P)-dependent oxidoreductase [uncultured Cohaesibacter sp.]
MMPRSIMITGASRGLGASLARAYAGEGVRLILTARRIEALTETCRQCEAAGAQVLPLALDLGMDESIDDILAHLVGSDLPDLLIANAGVFSGRRANGQLEASSEQARQLRINLTGTIGLLDTIAQRMKERRSGHLALISSLAAIQPQPDSPAYAASKAGLALWGRSIGEDLSLHGVAVSIIYPGHIESDQTAIHVGQLPGLLPADKAAAIIHKGIGKRRERIIFPRHLYWLILVSNLLPGRLRRWVNRPFRYHVSHEETPR